MNYGYLRIATAVPNVKVADCNYNVASMIALMQQAEKQHVQLLCFPELAITAYTCADLFFQQQLLDEALLGLDRMVAASYNSALISIVGMPLLVDNLLFNVAVVIQNGKMLAIVPKTFLPNNNEFYEKRWFASATQNNKNAVLVNGVNVPFGTNILIGNTDFKFAIELCEDLWVPIPPSSQHSVQGADIIFNLSASNALIAKNNYVRALVSQQSARCHAAYAYCSCGFGESTTDVVFAGNALIAENGKIVAQSKRFSLEAQLVVADVDIERLRAERLRNGNFFVNKSTAIYQNIEIDEPLASDTKLLAHLVKHPFVPPVEQRNEHCNEIFSIQTSGLAKRWLHTGAQNMIIGISGGLDSTLALLVAVKTADLLGFDRKRVVGITMPGFGTTDRTYNNAIALMQALDISIKEISIAQASLQHFADIEHDAQLHDVTYENTQARIRTLILMNYANKMNGLVVGTGDLSELALGWATYNGDHMSMYGVNSGVPKTLVRYLVQWAATGVGEEAARILLDVLDTPVSPELLPANADGDIAQKTEDLVGPYELHDFFLYQMVRHGFTVKKIFFLACHAFEGDYSEDIIRKWLKTFVRRFFSQQFKRSCMPDGPKVGSINLSPRGDWRMPSDAVAFETEI